jgi:DNA-binding CsgD family transcriptional regulator
VNGRATEADNVELILAEITAAMGGRNHKLSLHNDDGLGTSITEMSPAIQTSETGAAALDHARALAAIAVEGHLIWSERDCGLEATVSVAGGERFPDHGRLMITISFDTLTIAAMRHAERSWSERRIFVSSYLHLWYRERALRERARAAEAALDQIDIAFLLLNRMGNVLFANAGARALLDANDGLRRMRGSVGASRLSEGVSFQVALNHALTTNAEQSPSAPAIMVALTRQSGPSLVALVLPAPFKAVLPDDAAVAIYLSDPGLDVASLLGPVCRLYRLSPVETTLVTHLAQGLPLAEAAKLMHIRELTARTYMKQIYIKTDTSRQTELVVLMLSSLVRVRPSAAQTIVPLACEHEKGGMDK